MATKLDVSAKLRKATSVKKSSSTSPALSTQKALVDEVVRMKKELEDMENAQQQLQGELDSFSRTVYDDARKNGTYTSTVFAEGDKSNGIMVVYSDKYSVLPMEKMEELQKLDKKYNDHFVEVREIKVVKDAGKTISDATIEKLMKALGEDEFFKIFEIKQSIGCVKGMAEKIDELPDQIKNMLVQCKPSFRNVTEDGKVC
jgi:hypothetical protein